MTTAAFNDARAVVQGWHWVCRSTDVRRGKVKALRLLGRELAVYRGDDGRVVALDAYCAHMGAHLAEGRVKGNRLRCFFHHWRYDADGRCDDIPCLRGAPPAGARVQAWPAAERYGLVWIWTGAQAAHDVPSEPELDGVETEWRVGNRFEKNCHPNVVLINAIDEQHFHSVHRLPGSILDMQAQPRSDANIEFHNIGRLSGTRLAVRWLARLYRGALTYRLSYWYGGLGFVTLGPDCLHLHLLFALRRGDDGETIGQTVALTRRRRGVSGWLANRAILALTSMLAAYFARGDTRVFQTIRFDFRTPIGADRAVSAFIRHFEKQPLADEWMSGERGAPTAMRTNLHSIGGSPTLSTRADDLERTTARLLRRRAPVARPDGRGPLWDAGVYGLERVAAYRAASATRRRAVLDDCAAGMLEESWLVERCGIGFCARMSLASDELAERQMYALIGADEAAHCAWLRPWRMRDDALPDAFNAFLDECVANGSPQPLAYLLQVVLEGYGVVHYARLARDCRDAALATTFERMAQDEALHYAGGLAAFRAERLSAVDRRFLGDAAYTFLQMIRCGPQAVVGALDRALGIDDATRLAEAFASLDETGATAGKLARMRTLMQQPGMDWLLDRLDGLHAFSACDATESASLYAAMR